jgi:hypothetical protein
MDISDTDIADAVVTALLRWRKRQTRCADAPVSDCEGELAEDGRVPAAGVGVKSELVVAAAQVLNERMPATDRLGAAQPFQTAHRSRPRLQPTMIGFDRVVGVLLHHMPRLRHHLVEHPRVGRCPVGGHLGRPPRGGYGLGEEPAGGCQIRFDEARTSMTCPCWSIARYKYTHCPATFR